MGSAYWWVQGFFWNDENVKLDNGSGCVTWRPDFLMVGVEPMDPTKTKSGRRKDWLLHVSCEKNTRDLSQSNVSLNSKLGEVLSYGYMHIHEGVWAEGNAA